MEDFELSVMSYNQEQVGKLQSLLSEFEAQNHIRVHIRTLSWDSSWSEILKFVFQGHGPAVSEVGNTWVISLAKMNALRAFDSDEVGSMGGAGAFIPETWHTDPINNANWSIPWLAETRVIYYWRDLLKAAGVEEKTAFGTHKQLENTLKRLQKNGVSNPWIIPTAKTTNTLHNIRSWIGGATGDFVDADHRRVTFADKASRSGIKNYYSLYRFLSPEFYGFTPPQVDGVFQRKEAAVTINGPWAIFHPSAPLPSQDLKNIGVAPLPGVSSVLASDLVIWKHTSVRHERIAVNLVKFLTSHKAQLQCPKHSGLLPARLETLESKSFSADPFYQVFVDGLKSGRSLPTMRLWGLVEERLTAALAVLWAKILAEPNPDLDAIIKAELEPLAQRLNHILQ